MKVKFVQNSNINDKKKNDRSALPDTELLVDNNSAYFCTKFFVWRFFVREVIKTKIWRRESEEGQPTTKTNNTSETAKTFPLKFCIFKTFFFKLKTPSLKMNLQLILRANGNFYDLQIVVGKSGRKCPIWVWPSVSKKNCRIFSTLLWRWYCLKKLHTDKKDFTRKGKKY